jgi:FkbM family methyltransferase
MILLTGFYRDSDESRHGELVTCLQRNLDNCLLNEIHLFIEDSIEPAALSIFHSSTKIRLINHGRRVKFQELFAYANKRLIGQRVIIANADIFFDHTLARLDGYNLSDKLLSLSRWDVQPDGSLIFFDHPSSQDAWIFQTPIRDFPCDFYLGVPGCDNRLAWEAEHAGLAIANPGRSIMAQHLHLSGIHRYSERERYSGPTKSLPPGFLRTSDLNGSSASRSREYIYALTSLSPAPERVSLTRRCIDSWRKAGLKVRAFNHPSEILQLAKYYDVEFVAVAETTAAIFGRHVVPISAMLDWAIEKDVSVLLINSDIYLRLADWEMKRVRWLSDGGLCYFVRYNHDGDLLRALREPYGIDGFLFQGRHIVRFPRTFLSMGQPFWDYWIPHLFAAAHRPIYAVEFPAAFHQNHASLWSWENWHRCALEFARITGASCGNQSLEACVDMSVRVRRNFDQHKISLSQSPFNIMQWVRNRFASSEPKTFLELGSHQGTDTVWMADIPGVNIHAFEPDPRNHQPPRPNVAVHSAAIAASDGAGALILSEQGWGQQWTHSSSIRSPKNHLQRFPVTFGAAVPVKLVALDTFCEQSGIEVVDFIWADIQGAEGDMIRGGRRTLSNTRYLYTEYSDDELYDGQITLSEILGLLPGFRVLELWPDDVLLENTMFKGATSVVDDAREFRPSHSAASW